MSGVEHVVSVRKKWTSYIVSINGIEYKTFKLGKNSAFAPNEDFPLVIGGQEYILALRAQKIRLAKDGRYLGHDEEHIPVQPFPKWVWIFFVANIGLIAMGGAIPAGFGAAGLVGCASLMQTNKNMGYKLGACILATVGAWAGALFASGIFYAIMNSFR